MMYLLFASLQLTLLSFGSAQLALQVQSFRLRCPLFSQNLLHVVFHLQEKGAYIIYVMYYKTQKVYPPVSARRPEYFAAAWTGRCTRTSSRLAAFPGAGD